MKKHTKGKALAGDGHEQGLAGDQISIESDDGDTLALYTWHWLTATYTGTDKGLKNIVWAAQQASFPSEYSQYDYNQILVMFDPPTSELINNQARTKVLIYGAFLLPANAAKGVDIYARALEPQVSVQRGVKNFPCTVPSVPSGNIMSLTSLEGNPLEADKAFHMFAATYSTYDGKAPSQSAGFVNWSARIVGDTDARVERIFPYDGDGLTQYLSNQEPQYSLYGFRVISSVPTLVDVTATMTVPEQFSRTIRVLFQENAALPLAGIMEFTPQDPMPWPVTDRNEPRRVWLNYSRPGGVPEKTRIHWWAFEVLTTKIGVSRTFVDKDGNTTNDVSRILSYGDDDDKGRIVANSLNPQTGAYDHATLPVLFEYEEDIGIVITPQEANRQSLYAPRTINAVYSGSKAFSRMEWSVDVDENPEYIINFTNDPSSVSSKDGKLMATTQMVVTGPNRPVTVTVYARSLDGDFVTGWSYPLTFFPAAQAPDGKVIEVLSFDGDTLKERNGSAPQWHLLQAIFRQLDGTPVAGWPLTWSADDSRVIFAEQTTSTDANGVATNVIQTTSTAPFEFRVAVAAGQGDHVYAYGLLLTFQPEVQPLPGQTLLTIASPDGTDNLAIGKTHPVFVQDVKKPVAWAAFPSDRLSFTLSDTDPTTNYVKASPGADIPVAVIAARAFHSPSTYMRETSPVGIYDYSAPDLVLSFKAGPPDDIHVASEETPPLTLYAPHILDATYTGSADTGKKITSYVWSVDPNSDPQHTYRFIPNPSRAVNGASSTRITGLGPNAAGKVTVYARAVGIEDGKLHVGTLTDLAFKANASPPATAFLTLISADGNPLSTDSLHVVQALCTTAEGTPRVNQAVDWEVSPASVALETNGPTLTDQDGIATNLVSAPSTVTGSVTAWLANDETVSDALALLFQSDDTILPQQGTMTVTCADPSPLSLNEAHALTVQYLKSDKTPMPKGTSITWTGFPADRLSFANATTQVEDDQGHASNVVTGLGVTDIPTAVITTVAFNDQTMAYDHGDLITRFQYRSHPSEGVFGILLDKAYANNPSRNQQINPRDPTQVIKCQVQVNGVQGQQRITFPFNPGGSPPPTAPKLYDSATFSELPKQEDGTYYTQTTQGSTPPTATILVGARDFALFTLGTGWSEPIQPKVAAAGLVIATNRGEQSQLWPAPTIPALVGGNLAIPAQRPAPTFKVFLPPSSTLATNAPVAFALNSRLVYSGVAEPGLAGGIDVAYASVMADGSDNSLVYVVPGGESAALKFTASGIAQTGPVRILARSLPAPQLAGSLTKVGPGDIVSWLDPSGAVNGGLPVQISPYPGVAVDDTVTVYFYLSGEDALTGLAATNIVPVIYQVQAGDPLLNGVPAILYLPQWAAAGYGNGTLQMDYSVQPKGSINLIWSNIAPTCILNTTF